MRMNLTEEQKKARRRLRENARNKGEAYYRVHTTGFTVEQKIAHYSAPQDNGCVYWTSPAKGAPQLRFGGKCHSVRTLLWEKREGRPLPQGHIVYVECDHPRCIGETCLRAMPRGQFLHSGVAHQRAQVARRMLYGKDRERYLIEALVHVKSVRGLLYRKFGPRLDREDVLQEALLRVYLAWARDRQHVDDVRAFFVQIALNIATDVCRSASYSRLDYRDHTDAAILRYAAPPPGRSCLSLRTGTDRVPRTKAPDGTSAQGAAARATGAAAAVATRLFAARDRRVHAPGREHCRAAPCEGAPPHRATQVHGLEECAVRCLTAIDLAVVKHLSVAHLAALIRARAGADPKPGDGELLLEVIDYVGRGAGPH